MKTNLILSVMVSICFFVSCKDNKKNIEANPSHNNPDMHEDNAMMKKMDATMKAVPMTGNLDIDFANMMIVHHQGAIDMALSEVEKGTDEKLKMMAQNIITSQTEEQGKLRDMVKILKPQKAGSETLHHELNNSMNTMMDKMKGMQMSGNTDKDFVMMMIPHHEAAIDMAKILLSQSKNSQLKQMAQKVITDQSKEIKEFQMWLSANK